MESITCGVCNWNSNEPTPKFIHFAGKNITRLINILKIVGYFYSVKRTALFHENISFCLFFFLNLISRYRATTFCLSFHLDLHRWAIFLRNDINYCLCNLADSNLWVYNYDAKISPVFQMVENPLITNGFGQLNYSSQKKAANDYYHKGLFPLTSHFISSLNLIGFSTLMPDRCTKTVYIQEISCMNVLVECANSCGFNQLVTNVDIR